MARRRFQHFTKRQGAGEPLLGFFVIAGVEKPAHLGQPAKAGQYVAQAHPFPEAVAAQAAGRLVEQALHGLEAAHRPGAEQLLQIFHGDGGAVRLATSLLEHRLPGRLVRPDFQLPGFRRQPYFGTGLGREEVRLTARDLVEGFGRGQEVPHVARLRSAHVISPAPWTGRMAALYQRRP